ncbi:MAG: ATP-binding protein [Tannerellaceae bacterium]|nr:ATP-binding protein [Tannerellaceae bacterium]
MLIKFAVTNFRGFPSKIEWDLAHPNSYEFNSYAIRNGIVKNGIIYGPNGSGKTNFGLAIFDIENHLTQKWKKTDYYSNFVYAGNPAALVVFEYTFKMDLTTIEYTYSKNAQGILLQETLRMDNKQIFSRNENAFDMDSSEFPMDDSVKKRFVESTNNVSIINYLLTSFPLSENHYLIRMQKFVDSMLWFRNLDVREFIGLETAASYIDEFIISNSLLEDFSEFLQTVSGQVFNFVASKINNQNLLFCKLENAIIPFNTIASTGTQSLMLLYYWIKKIDGRASFVFIDEFDAFYHFMLSFEVCKRLFALDCQVFTSSHNTYLMTNDLLRPDCNFILNHNQIKPLCECTEKELRFGHNIEKLFRGNAFQI